MDYHETPGDRRIEFDEDFYARSLIPASEQKETLAFMRNFFRDKHITNPRIIKIIFTVAHHLPLKRVKDTLDRCIMHNGRTPAYFRTALEKEIADHLEGTKKYLYLLKKSWKVLNDLKSGQHLTITEAANNRLLEGFFAKSGLDFASFSLNDENALENLNRVEDLLLQHWDHIGRYATRHGWKPLVPPNKHCRKNCKAIKT